MSEPTNAQEAPLAAIEAIAEPATVQPDLENGGGSGEDSGEDEVAGADGVGAGEKKKKKKKKPKKKKGSSAAAATAADPPVSANGEHVKPVQQQTKPPSIPLSKIYVNGQFPVGEICEYKDECVWSFIVVLELC